MKKGFTLIELLAVIIILAIIALIATPVVLKVVDSAKESGRKSSIAGYADAIKLSINEKIFETKGTTPEINTEFLNSLDYQGERVTCDEVKSTNNYGVILKTCKVEKIDNTYCFAKGKVYNCDDTEFNDIYDNLEDDTNVYKDKSGANPPILYTNMIPVSYDGTNWIYADQTKEWYNYDDKKWANAVVLNNNITKNIGDIINVESDVLQMYVWIPRYKYTIFNGNYEPTLEQVIDVTFEKNKNSTGTVKCLDTISGNGDVSETCTDNTNNNIINGTSTYTHPAFTFGNSNLTGFWVGKFETSNVKYCVGTSCDNPTLGIQIKPNVTSWTGAKLSTIFTAISNMASEYEISSNSHMMKNMEWGAVAYLKQSKYGLGLTEIGKNNNQYYTTGCGSSSKSSQAEYCNPYDTSGKQASTNGNITGIYDMSGGLAEYVMGNMVTANGVPMVGHGGAYLNSGFSGKLATEEDFEGIAWPEKKYYDAYSYSSSSIKYNRGKLGDATKETMTNYSDGRWGWYSNGATFVYSLNSWFKRGGSFDFSLTGIFEYSAGIGAANVYTSRVVLAGTK